MLSAIEAVGDADLMELFNNYVNAPQSDMFKVLDFLVKGIIENTSNL